MKSRISVWLLATVLVLASLAVAQGASAPPRQAKPSALKALDKAQEARQAGAKSAAKANAALPAGEKSAPAPAARPTPAQAPDRGQAEPQSPAGAQERLPRTGERRDPFRTMIREKVADQPIQVECGALTRSILIGQTELSGIVKEPGGYLAVVSVRSPAGDRTYFLRENTPVCNGEVQSITPDSIVFLENVLDPMGRAVKREVIRKIPAEAK